MQNTNRQKETKEYLHLDPDVGNRGVNYYTPTTYMQGDSQTVAQKKLLDGGESRELQCSLGVLVGSGCPRGGGGVGLARRVGIGLEKLRRSTAVIFWTFLS